MDSNEEIVFKKPTIDKKEDTNETEGTQHLSVEEVAKKAVSSQSVAKTVLPQPMTLLAPPIDQYFIDQLKNGVIVEHKVVDKSRLVFGRAQDCDVILEHPSVSRYHSVLLWSPVSEEGFKNGLITNTLNRFT